MNDILRQMAEIHGAGDESNRDQDVRELVQELALYGLSMSGFFRKAAFVGGTALRLFHGLDRFSEDLDFMLTDDRNFNIDDYLPELEKRLYAFGVTFDVSKDERTNPEIEAATLNSDSEELYLTFYSEDDYSETIYRTQLTRIKIEISKFVSEKAEIEVRTKNMPYPHEVVLFDEPTLFAGKIHALLCRGWKTRVKGRDLYDFLFYARSGVAFNLGFLNDKLKHSGHSNVDLTHMEVIELLKNRFEEIDYESAKNDVRRFLKIEDRHNLDKWCPELFTGFAVELVSQDQIVFP